MVNFSPNQVKYSPRRQVGFGTADDETTERLWSFARPFRAHPQRTDPSHRTDLLTDVLLHYAHRKKDCMRKCLSPIASLRLVAATRMIFPGIFLSDVALMNRLSNTIKKRAACQEAVQEFYVDMTVTGRECSFEVFDLCEHGN